jgi:hypothetical protein
MIGPLIPIAPVPVPSALRWLSAQPYLTVGIVLCEDGRWGLLVGIWWAMGRAQG